MTGEVGRVPSDIDAAYAACRRLHRRHDPTYYVATRVLPPPVRPATHALYGFVRGADEIVDRPYDAARVGERAAALDAWHGALLDGLARGRSDHPVIAALVDAATRHDLPLDNLAVYMRSMRRDLEPGLRMATYAELDEYMEGSAGSVGRIMGALLGVPERHRERFGALGKAFQLTNFVRDVREDHALGRVYLPVEDRERFGVAEADLAAARPHQAVRALLAHEARRARELFAQARPAVRATHARVRPGIHLACARYGRVLSRAGAPA